MLFILYVEINTRSTFSKTWMFVWEFENLGFRANLDILFSVQYSYIINHLNCLLSTSTIAKVDSIIIDII